MDVDRVEKAVEEYYVTVKMPEEVQRTIQTGLERELDRQRKQAAPEMAHAQRRIQQLEVERRRLARGVVDGSVPGDLARKEQERVARELAEVQRLLEAGEVIYSRTEDTLSRALTLIGRCDEIYKRGGAKVRRLSKQFFFEKLLVRDGRVVDAVLREPWGVLVSQRFRDLMEKNANPDGRSSRRGLNIESLARPAGFEPATPGSGGRCSVP